MKEDLIRKFVEKLDYSYNYKTVNERQSIINDLCEIAGIEQLTIPAVIKSVCNDYFPSFDEINKCLHCGFYKHEHRLQTVLHERIMV